MYTPHEAGAARLVVPPVLQPDCCTEALGLFALGDQLLEPRVLLCPSIAWRLARSLVLLLRRPSAAQTGSPGTPRAFLSLNTHFASSGLKTG